VCATPEAIAGLSGLQLEDGPGRFLIVRSGPPAMTLHAFAETTAASPA
jgi:hypothetical protein